MPDTYMMTAEELRLYRRKRRRFVVVGIVLVLVIVGGFFGARPGRDAVKGWQSRRHAQKAFDAIEKEKWQDARDEAIAAYQLRPNEPQAVRAVARFLSRTRQAEALEYWGQLEKIDKLTAQDLRDDASVALAAGDVPRAEAAVQTLLKSPQPTPADWLLDAQLTIQKGLAEEALAALDKLLADPAATEPQQFQAAILERSVAAGAIGASDRVQQAWDRLQKLSSGKSETALNALVLMSQQVLTQPKDATAPFSLTGDQVRQALESHPVAKAPHKLLALDLELHADPERKDAVLEKAINDWKNGDPPSLVALATWLNGKGEYQKTLDTIPLEKALQNRDVFLQHLDALGALGKWEDIRQVLEAERFPLDQTIEHMYLARCYEQLGQKTAAENSWKRAVEAAGGDAAKLVSLAEYAEKNGKIDIADAAYSAAIAQNPKIRQAWNGRLRIVQATRDTHNIHEVLAGMLHVWPNDAAIQNDEAYTRLLLLISNKRGNTDTPTRRNAETSGSVSPSPSSELPASTTPQPLNTSTSQNADTPTLRNGETNQASSIQDPASATKELEEISALAAKLVELNPRSLPHRTLLALARLKRSKFPEALQVYANIQVAANALTSSALAVHAAVLFANGKTDDAKAEVAQLKRTQLLPEEWALVEGLQAQPEPEQ